MPCSGLKSATSVTSFASCSRSIVVAPSRARPVWLVTSPTRLPLQRREAARRAARRCRSATGAARGGAGGVPDAPKSRPVRRVGCGCRRGRRRRSTEAATVATRARSGVTSPLPSGCTRFDRNTTNILVAGSIHSDVPVNPVWPNEPSGSSSPRFDENDESMSQPRPRTLRSPGGVAGVVIFATVSGDRMRVPWYAPPFEQHAAEDRRDRPPC